MDEVEENIEYVNKRENRNMRWERWTKGTTQINKGWWTCMGSVSVPLTTTAAKSGGLRRLRKSVLVPSTSPPLYPCRFQPDMPASRDVTH